MRRLSIDPWVPDRADQRAWGELDGLPLPVRPSWSLLGSSQAWLARQLDRSGWLLNLRLVVVGEGGGEVCIYTGASEQTRHVAPPNVCGAR
jgi:hypothetical protein